MKNTLFYSASLLLLISFISCNKEHLGSPYENSFALTEKENSKLESIPFLLTYEKKTYSFPTKRDMLSFLAANEKSARYFYYEWVLLELHKKYEGKYGKDYSKDNSLIDQLTTDFIEELEADDLTIETDFLACIECLLQGDHCLFFYYFDEPGDINFELFDEENFQGEQFEITNLLFAAGLFQCKQINGSLNIHSLRFGGNDWNNRISSFKFSTRLRYESLLLTFLSESDMRGAEHSYFLRPFEHEKIESDLSQYLWRIRGIPVPVENNISSIKVQATGLQRP